VHDARSGDEEVEPVTTDDLPAGSDALSRLGQQMLRQSRAMHAMKATLYGGLTADVDLGALTVLFHLVRGGTCRQVALAEGSLLDPSTVSRHVAALVRGGLAERRPDLADGRAVVLAATAAGEAVVRGMQEARDRMLQTALQDWSEADLDALAALMSRLNDDFDTYRQSLPAQHLRAGAPASRDA
jgi:DNA-binding MarR family transcriptional regulator